MRIVLIADIHGNLPALEAVLVDARTLSPDVLVVAGDMVNGPQPQAVLDLLLAEDALMLRGNHENYTLDLARDAKRNGRSKQWQAMRWSFRRLREGTLDLLRDLPEQRVIAGNGTAPVRVVHGSPASDRETLIPDRDPAVADTFRRAGLLAWDADPKPLSRALAGVRQPVMVCAHSHLQWQQQEDGCLVVNPGSAGMTTDGDPRASYALLDWHAGNAEWRVEHRRVAYDLASLRRLCKTNGYLAEGGAFARACLLASETGQNVALRLIRYTGRRAREMGFGEVVPDDAWDAMVTEFDWDRAVAAPFSRQGTLP